MTTTHNTAGSHKAPAHHKTFLESIGAFSSSTAFITVMNEFVTKGLSIKTWEPVVNKTVKLAIQYEDGLDGRVDGVLHRDAIVKQLNDQLDKMLADPKSHFTAEQRAKIQANRGLMSQKIAEKLPEAFSINDKAAEALVHSTMERVDKNKDGRINLSEAMAAKEVLNPAAIFSLITPATPVVPQGHGAPVRIPG